jgi:hypothetical protein
LFEGNIVLFRIAIAILKLFERDILQTSDGAALETLIFELPHRYNFFVYTQRMINIVFH